MGETTVLRSKSDVDRDYWRDRVRFWHRARLGGALLALVFVGLAVLAAWSHDAFLTILSLGSMYFTVRAVGECGKALDFAHQRLPSSPVAPQGDGT